MEKWFRYLDSIAITIGVVIAVAIIASCEKASYLAPNCGDHAYPVRNTENKWSCESWQR